MEPYRTETVETPAGVYTVELHYDEYAERPENEGLGFAFVGGRNQIDAKMGEHADEVLSLIKYHSRENAYNGNIYDSEIRSAAAIARYLRLKYGLKGIREVDEGYGTREPSSDRGESIHGLAWAPDDATYPGKYTDGGIAEYRAWAEGECYGYVVNDPDGADVESVWGFYGDAGEKYMLEEAHASVKHDAEQRYLGAWIDAEQRFTAANLAGAGIVGLI